MVVCGSIGYSIVLNFVGYLHLIALLIYLAGMLVVRFGSPIRLYWGAFLSGLTMDFQYFMP